MKKLITFSLVCVLCLLAFTSCVTSDVTKVNVKIVDHNQTVMYEGEVTIVRDAPTVIDALYSLETAEEITLGVENGSVTNINNMARGANSSGEYFFYWRYTLNNVTEDQTVTDESGEESFLLTGITIQPVVNGDTILIEYIYFPISDLE